MPVVVDGKAIAAEVIEETKAQAAQLAATGTKVGLAVVIVGDDPASHAYVGAKGKKAKECGFHSLQFTLPESTTQKDLVNLVVSLNADDEVDGILVQLPLPKHLDSEAIIQSIAPSKDVDGLNTVNAGKIVTGDLASGLTPCTPAGAMVLVERIHGKDLSGLHAVVVGRSNLFGKPMAALLLAANATVTSAHSRTKNLAEMCQLADILVVAVGRAEMVKKSWVKDGATVIDVGINRVADESGKGKLVGDVEYATVAEAAGAITPVPGGVGPMTIAMLMANTLKAAFLRSREANGMLRN